MRAAALAALFLVPVTVTAQPVLEERLILAPLEQAEPPQFQGAPRSSGFQTRIVRSSIRDHLRDYRVRVRQDGIAVQKRFTIGR